MHKQIGYSLLEVMIVLALSIMLIRVGCAWIVTVSAQWLVVDQIAKTLERGRAATGVLEEAFQHAGYLGCQTLQTSKQLGVPLAWILQQPAVILGNDNQSAVIILAEYGIDSHHKTQQLLINKAIGTAITFQIVDKQRKKIRLLKPLGIRTGAQLVVNDCLHHQFVKVQAVNSDGTLELDKPVVKEFLGNMTVSIYQSAVFYIANTGRYDQATTPVYALYHAILSAENRHDVRELIDFVESIHLQLLTDKVDSASIRAIIVELLLRSEQILIDGRSQIHFADYYYHYQHPYLLKPWRMLFALFPQENHES